MHIVMSCIGTYGDVLPQIAIGRSLAGRGHEVEFLSAAYFRDMVEAAGLRFHPVMSAEDYLNAVRDPLVWTKTRGLQSSWRHFAPVLRQGFEVISRVVRPESVLTGGTMAFWARLAAEKFGNPGATIHLAPLFLMSAAQPPRGVLPGFERLPAPLRRAGLAAIDRLIIDPVMAGDVNRLRARLGLAPVKRITGRWMHAPQRVICAFPEWFCAPAEDWPANTVCTGFARPPPGPDAALSPDLIAFCAGGAPPVVFTPGSGMGSSARFFARGLAACAALGQRAVLVTKFADQLPDPLPAYAFHAPFAAFEQLAPLAAAFVHPGGIGTTGLLMECGTRQLFAPFAADQMDIAARAAALGVGLRLSPNARQGRWTAMLGRLLADEAIARRCAEIAPLARAALPGDEQIAGWIERLGEDSLQAPAVID